MYRCPNCKYKYATFTIEHQVTHKTCIDTEGGTVESEESDLTWEDDDSMTCDECGHEGTTKDFQGKEYED